MAWQFIGDAWPSCHFWQGVVKRSFLAMLIIFAVAAIAAYALISALIAIPKDGYRAVRTDPRRLP